MPLIGELVTRLKADTTNFNNKLTGSENRVSKFAGTAAKAGAAIAIAVGTVAVAGFVKLLNIINDTADKIDDLAKRASKFGGDVQAFQRLEYVAALAGVEISTLESGMGRLVKAMADAKRGTGEAKDAFKELGLSVEELDKMSIDKQYIAISNAMKNVADSNRQAQLAVQIFGRSGVNQLNLLREDLSGLSADFDKFGGGLTNKQAKAVESYNDSVTRLGAVFETFKIQLTAQVAPALEEIVNWIANTTLEMGGLGPVANLVAQYFVGALQMIVSGAQKVIDVIELISYGFKSAQLQILEFMQAFSELNFELTGGDFNFKRLDEIIKLKRDLNNTQLVGARVTDPLQSGLQRVQNTLQANSQQKVQVNITTEKGLKAEVAESPEVTAQVNKLIEQLTERSN